ncbi:DUF917 domain-containing protein [Kutzneria viridogrisea]|uniref:DUF917 domain-containing protein n=1 Tax=Kutzneria viridogrisea TaxID=47990 RepID=A0ABR6BE62_9PSEU|nr:hypothetical protein [Kutzneria viridogrisea]
MRELDLPDLDDLARGAALLGSGGGGDPYIGTLLARAAITRHGPVRVVTVEELPPDALVVPVSMLGAPTVGVEKLPSGKEVHAALRALERVLGRAATHLVAIEIGGGNSMVPVAAAAETGLPLLDADAMGRAFPEAQMVLPTLSGISTTPMTVADDKGNTAVIDAVSNHWAERIARAICGEAGCSVYTADTVLTAAQARDTLVLGTLTLAQRAGAAIRLARAGHADPVRAVTDLLGGAVLAAGKVVDVSRATTGGFARGEAVVHGPDGTLVLSFQNEHLVARLADRVVATTPDLICVVDTETGEPVTTEALRYGFRVTVLGLPCDPRWTSPEGLALVGPPAFGYDCGYRPLPS